MCVGCEVVNYTISFAILAVIGIIVFKSIQHHRNHGEFNTGMMVFSKEFWRSDKAALLGAVLFPILWWSLSICVNYVLYQSFRWAFLNVCCCGDTRSQPYPPHYIYQRESITEV